MMNGITNAGIADADRVSQSDTVGVIATNFANSAINAAVSNIFLAAVAENEVAIMASAANFAPLTEANVAEHTQAHEAAHTEANNPFEPHSSTNDESHSSTYDGQTTSADETGSEPSSGYDEFTPNSSMFGLSTNGSA